MLVDDPESPNISPTPNNPFPYSVQRWKDNAVASYLCDRNIRNSEVKAITWRKDTDGSEHEYIVVECHRPGQKGVSFYMRIERQPANFQSSVVPDTQAEERDPRRRSFWTFLQELTDKSKPKVDAMDSVSQVSDRTGSVGEGEGEIGEREIARYHFQEGTLFVRDLAFLSCIVHSYRPKYEVFVYQCYWYCQTIINVLNEVYQPTVTQGENFGEEGTYRIKRRWFRSRPFTVNKPCELEVDRIQREFEAALESHDAQVRRRDEERSGRQETLGRKIRGTRRQGGFADPHVQEDAST